MTSLLASAAMLLCAISAGAVEAQGFLEIPAPKSTQTGIGVVSGWHCSANRIEIVIDDGAPLLAGSHTSRDDTLGVCGRADTGFSLLFNWNLLPIHCFGCFWHRVVALADGVPFASAEFGVTHFGAEFMTGMAARYLLPNFPQIGDTTWVEWDEAKQNFSVHGTARDEVSVSGTYYGALEYGAHAPYCGPWPPDRVLPVKHGSFRVHSADGRLSLTAQYVDGTTCKLPEAALAPHDRLIDRDGYVRAVFDQDAAALCPDFPGGVVVEVNGQRLVATARDNCTTALVWAAK